MPAPSLLLIDDDATLLELLASHLRTAGYPVRTAPDGPAGLRLAAEALPRLVVLDVMMPGMDGWQVCERLHALGPVPIILLTAKSEEVDKLRGFRLGVDDYVSKPFSFAELTARVGAVLARSANAAPAGHTFTSGELNIEIDHHRVTLAGQPVELTPTEYRLLDALARQPHRTVPVETLLEAVWGPAYSGEADNVKHFVWTLRQKIEADPGNPQHVLTERGFGYRLE